MLSNKLLLLGCTVLLGACASKPTVVIEYIKPPSHLLSGCNSPVLPDPIRTNGELARAYLGVRGALRECILVNEELNQWSRELP